MSVLPEHVGVEDARPQRPKLSIVIPNYNYARFLDRAIESVLTQTFSDFELIVIDNASTDDSLEVVRRHAARDPRIRVVAHPANLGMLASLRESCDVARGQYRLLLDADDWILEPDAVAAQVELLDRWPDVAFTYSRLTMVDWDGNVIHTSRPYDGDRVLSGAEAIEGVLRFNLNDSGMMIRLSAYRRTAGYPSVHAQIADIEVAARLCEVGGVGYIDRCLYAFHQHGDNLHNRPPLKILEDEILPVVEAAFSGPLSTRIDRVSRVRRRVLRYVLVHLPTQYIFAGEPAIGWRLWWESLKSHPLATAVQPRTLSLVMRTLLGEHGYARVRSTVPGLRHPDHNLLEATR